jgi:hypothetical protein
VIPVTKPSLPDHLAISQAFLVDRVQMGF